MSHPDDMPELPDYSPSAAVTEMERHVKALWTMLDSDDCPFDAPMRATRRKRLKALLTESADLTRIILRKHFEEDSK